MAFLSVPDVAVRGISACAPAHVEENAGLPVFREGEASRVIAQTGIERRHTIADGITTSDMCARAFDSLVAGLHWDKRSIEAIVFVTSAADYIVPPTSCVLQDRLGLPEECLCIDIRHGCPGWVVGLSSAAALLGRRGLKRAVLLCGDSPTYLSSPLDKETRPLFSDAGTATALEYQEGAPPIEFHFGTRGKDYKAIHTPCGFQRSPVTKEALEYKKYGEHRLRRGIDFEMDGMSVFGFGLSVAPESVKALCGHYGIDKEKIDFFLFHQANMYMNEKIRKKLGIAAEKVPYSLREFGNTSCASIPLTMVTCIREACIGRKLDNIGCAFGAGLAWGSVHFETDRIVCPGLITA